jgi:hypothetical protein
VKIREIRGVFVLSLTSTLCLIDNYEYFYPHDKILCMRETDKVAMAEYSEQQETEWRENVKSLYLSIDNSDADNIEYFPYFYTEARIDFNDVRTGYRETRSISKALEIYSPRGDMFWVGDMIQDVDPVKMQSTPPGQAQLNSLPEYVNDSFISLMEMQYLQYLVRSFEVRLYKNPALNIYSNAGESRDEFIVRCAELLESQMREELDQSCDVFKRRLEQLKEKYLSSDEFLGTDNTQLESRNRDAFSQYSEQIASLFLKGDGLSRPEISILPPKKGLELEECLIEVEKESHRAIKEIMESHAYKAQSLDEYILRPNLKDLHFVRSCILWMPKKAV